MSDGIGARVARKEDKRFLTGKGKYTDDIRVENQAYAAFVRSPVAMREDQRHRRLGRAGDGRRDRRPHRPRDEG
jgi:CO/xanthine dehydrogenase Mo-binding subunit